MARRIENEVRKIMKKYEQEESNIGIFLLLWITGIIVITPILFAIGISISYLNVICPLLILMFIFVKNSKDNYFANIRVVAYGIIIIVIIVLSSGMVFDQTWDGDAYHKTAVGLLKEGWNPLYNTAFEFNEKSGILPYAGYNPMKYAEAYPKATWYIAASIYYITGNIECGKAYTLIFSVITYFITLEYFSKIMDSHRKGKILAFFTALNPMVLDQMHCYYVDGVTGCVLIMLMIESLILLDDDFKIERRRHLLILGMLIIWGCNLKFSTLAFTAFICIITFLFCIYYYREDKRFCGRLFGFYAGTASMSILIVGATPYITNIYRYKDIFYGFSNMMNADSLENDFGVKGLGRAGRALASLFGKMSHGCYKSLRELLKIPFTYDKSELEYYSFVDLRVSGSGIFFSGIFVVTLGIIFFMLLKQKLNKKTDKLMLAFIILTILELLVFEGTYQIRYISHIYIIFIYSLILLWRNSDKRNMVKKRYSTILSVFLLLFMCLNNLPWIKLGFERINTGINYKYELEHLAKENIENKKTIAFWSYDFSGIHFNLKDYGIVDYDFVDMKELPSDAYTGIYGNWVMYY